MKKTAVFILLCALFACHKGNVHIPDDVVKPDSMVQVLTDIHIFQATLQLGYFSNDSAAAAKRAFGDILKKHNLTEQQYKKATEFYSYHPALLDSIYEKVINNLSEQKVQLQGTKKHP